MARPHPETISPTAHYTGFVWYARGQSHEAFATAPGRLMYRLLHAPNQLLHRVGLPSLEGMLLARHRVIDLQLQRAIAAGEISQIIEVAAGLSPRGWRFREQYGDAITYVEADLPGMRANKQRILGALGGERPHHRTEEIDALVDTGPTSIEAICATLDPTRGTAIVTEGLVNYFDHDTTVAMWGRFARALARFPHGHYYSDLVLGDDNADPFVRSFSWLLSAFVRGRVHLQFDTSTKAEAALVGAGFPTTRIIDPSVLDIPEMERAGARRVKIVAARR
ncbi:MAG: class I SAM-dependent methyltransferase [Proteobacteria bacterium]|nr:class I SAM-dependent methyltransferase [Pseudomonadota bacterium]